MQDFKLPNGRDPPCKLGNPQAWRELLFQARCEAGKQGVDFAEQWMRHTQPAVICAVSKNN